MHYFRHKKVIKPCITLKMVRKFSGSLDVSMRIECRNKERNSKKMEVIKESNF